MADNVEAGLANKAWERKLAEIERHFSSGTKYRYNTAYEFNSLHYSSSPEMVKYFISLGIDANTRNFHTGETPLQTAIRLNQSPAVLRELIKAGADIEVRNAFTLNTPLIQATQSAFWLQAIQVLLEYGADINAVNKQGHTPLHSACHYYHGDLSVVELLLNSGSSVNFLNNQDQTPLLVALKNPHCDGYLVKKLLQFHAVVSLKHLTLAVEIESPNYLNILRVIMQCIGIMSDIAWTNLIKSLLLKIRSEQKLEGIGRIIIKYSLLKCRKPYSLRVKIVPLFNYLRNGAVFQFIPRQPLIRETYLEKKGSFLKSVADKLESYCRKCVLEIAGMNKDMLKTNISVYYFTVIKTKNVCIDEKIINVLKENTYPVYSDMILNKIKRAAILDKLYQQQVYTVISNGQLTRRIQLDSLCVTNIAKYLSVEEIRELADAFCESPEDKYVWDDLVEIEDRISKISTQKSLPSAASNIKSKKNIPL